MASQKKSTAKTRGTASGSKKPAARSQAKGKAQQTGGISPTELIGLGLVGLAAVSLAVLITGDVATNAFKALLTGLAGVLCWAVPALLAWAGILIGFAGKKKYDVGRILLMVMCVLLVFAMVHIFSAPRIFLSMQLKTGYINFIQQSFFDRGGAGLLGALLAYPAYRLLGGKWGGFIALFFLLAGVVVWLKQISLRRLGAQAIERIETGREEYRQRREERIQQQQVLRMEREEQLRAERGNDWANWDEPLNADPAQTQEAQKPKTLLKSSHRLEVPSYIKDGTRRGGKILGGKAITPDEAADPQALAPEAEDSDNGDGLFPLLTGRKKKSRTAIQPEEEPIDEIPAIVPPTFKPAVPAQSAQPEEECEEEPVDVPAGDGVVKQPRPAAISATGSDLFPTFDEDEEDDEDSSPLFGRSPAPQPEEDEEEEPLDVSPVVQIDHAPSHAPSLEKPAQRERHRQELGKPVADILPPDSYASDVQPLAIEPERRLDGTPIEKDKHETYGMDEPFMEYNYPPVDLLAPPKPTQVIGHDQADQKKAQKLIDTLKSFGISVELTGIAHGPAVTRFEVYPAPGTKVSRITSLADDIALNLAAPSIRIEAPIPGKAAVGIEVPNDKVDAVPLREVLESAEARKNPSRLAFGVGKDNGGRCIVGDIAKMPHVLIAGATGSGKSVCINCIICSILYRATPDEVRLIMVDPKVVELSIYNGIPHLLTPVVTDPKKAAGALNWAVAEMTLRYRKFAERNVRNIKGYNMALEPDEKPMPQIVIIIDELADLMMVAPGEVEDSICRLAQLARAAGIHLVIATQRPSVNVITGTIKANIPARIAFTTSSYVDSRTILDVGGAEKLLGRGDMLFAPNGNNKMQRVQGAWVSDEEVNAIVEYIKNRHEAVYDEDVIEHMNRELDGDAPDAEAETESGEGADELLPQAVEMAVEAGQMSISMLQRRLRIGYARAGRLIDEMAARGIVSQSEGAKPRQVLITREQFQEMYGDN